MRFIAVRLHRGDDLKRSLESLAEKEGISAGCVVSAAGSLSAAKLRMAAARPQKQNIRHLDEALEIVSLTGTIARAHRHLHVALSRTDGSVVGGHMMEGCIVDTTVELVIMSDNAHKFYESTDETTGFPELKVVK